MSKRRTHADALEIWLRNPDVAEEDKLRIQGRTDEVQPKRKASSRKVEEDGYVFDSQGEHRRYKHLRLLERAGIISGLKVHPKFVLLPPGEHNGKKTRGRTWKADFQYVQTGTGLEVVEDYKGYMYPTYRVKLPWILNALQGYHFFLARKFDDWYTPDAT